MLTEHIITLLAESPGPHTFEALHASVSDRWPGLLADIESIRQALEEMDSLGVTCDSSGMSWQIEPGGLVSWMSIRLQEQHNGWWFEYANGKPNCSTLEIVRHYAEEAGPIACLTLVDASMWRLQRRQPFAGADVATVDLLDAVAELLTQEIAKHHTRR